MSIAAINNLNNDQVVELTTCFIQNIPYDEAKAEVVLGNQLIDDYDISQTPYETLYKNSGICTDKTYLTSRLLEELGYGTAIMVFPEAEHMALGILAPDGYGDFDTRYVYMEVTSPGFAPGEIPEDVSETNGKPTVSIRTYDDLTSDFDPSQLDIYSDKTISLPNGVIDVNGGKSYDRILLVRNLEDRILSGYDNLISRQDTLTLAYDELISRDSYQASLYSKYLSTPDTKLDCGYKYQYSYSYTYTYDYSYTSPYQYSCDYVSNPDKNYAYNRYSSAIDSYNAQVAHYNMLLDEYNSALDSVRADVNRYKAFDYN